MAADMKKGQRAYEEERARKAGVNLETWMKQKARKMAEAAKLVQPPPPPKKPSLLGRLIERAHKPIGKR